MQCKFSVFLLNTLCASTYQSVHINSESCAQDVSVRFLLSYPIPFAFDRICWQPDGNLFSGDCTYHVHTLYYVSYNFIINQSPLQQVRDCRHRAFVEFFCSGFVVNSQQCIRNDWSGLLLDSLSITPNVSVVLIFCTADTTVS